MNIKNNFKNRDFLTLMDFKTDEIQFILDVSQDFKKKYNMKKPHNFFQGRTIAMIFEKQSTRTRFSFQAAIAHLGMQSIFAVPETMQLARDESIKDTARVIDRYCDGLIIRTYKQEKIQEYADYMKHPVINALTDLTHPCQGLADMMTIKEHKGKIEGNKLAYIGDPWNVCNTLMISCSLLSIDCYVAVPKGWKPNKTILEFAEDNAKKRNTEMVVTTSLEEAIKDSDIVYANTFHSMGQKDIEERKNAFAKYQITNSILSLAKPDAIFMHCLPAYRGEEVTNSVIEGPKSVVFNQAENRIHTEKAILSLIIP